MEMCCPKCGAMTPLSGKFCMECGHSLAAVQPFSSIDYNTPGSYTPRFLVEKILTTRSSIEGERKLVTVLFADAVNSTAIAETLDAEVFRQIMDGTFKVLMDEIHNVEGTINQFTGDGIMALFGAPVAHEDHVQRACYAALCIQKAVSRYSEKIKAAYGFDFSLRIGINSGPVICGAIGDDLRMDYTAIGDTTNLAARMQQMARPGSIFVSGNSYRLAKEFFEFKNLGKLKVKGKKEPQETFELLKSTQVDTRIRASLARGLVRFVGRKSSMAALMQEYEKAHSGAGQVVGIVGEAGVGKSRLLLEFINALPHDEFTYLEGRCLHKGTARAYLPVLDILKSYFEITDDHRNDDDDWQVEKKLLNLSPKLRYAAAPLQGLLSLKVDSESFIKLEPQQKRTLTFEALRDFFVLLSGQKTLVLAVEDLQWIDKTSEEFINYLMGGIYSHRIMLILLYRPEYTHNWGSKSYYVQVGLRQLSTATSTALVDAILEDGETDSELRKLILEKAAGNPLFIEEFTRALVENGAIQRKGKKYTLSGKVSNIAVPDTIQGLIAARIDRLEEDIKHIIQVASVIGRDFAFRILQIISGMQEQLKSYLEKLQGMEFIYEKNLFPELEYIFKHALTQEVAYYSLLNLQRRELHRKIGEAMESTYPHRLTELSSIIGQHFMRAEDWKRAFYYLDRAGEAAAGLFAHPEARIHYAKALEALQQLDPTEENRALRVDTIIKHTSSSWRATPPDETLNLLSSAENLAKTMKVGETLPSDEALRLARVQFWMGRVYYLRGDMSEGIRYFKQVLPVAKALGDEELIAVPSSAIGQTLAVLGHASKAEALLTEAIPLLERVANWPEWVQAVGFLGSAKAMMGDYGAGLRTAQSALNRAKELNFITGIAVAQNCLGFAHLFGGDAYLAIKAAQQALQAADESGDRIYRYVGYGLWGWAAGRDGQLETASNCMAQSQEIVQELGGRVIMADVFTAAKAEIAFLGGHFDEALALAEQAVKIAQLVGGSCAEGVARRAWAQALNALPSTNREETEANLTESLRVLESGQNLMEMARTRVAWGKISEARGDLTGARDHWQRAADQFESSGSLRELAEVRFLLENMNR